MPAGTVLPPYPSSWYAFAFSDELPRGGVLHRSFLGEEVVLFRTASGQVCATEAYCPHLGAHFGFGGRVEGELLRCPFHAFAYDTQGVCVRTGYGTKPPPAARLTLWPVCETNGILLIYYDKHRRPPAWQIPPLEPEGWTPIRHVRFTLRDHPQETTENSVDLGHFAFVHGYTRPRMLREAVTEGPYLSTAYAIERALPYLERAFPQGRLEVEFETHIYGLGYSLVQVRASRVHLEARLWVLPTPIDETRLTLSLGTSVRITSPGRVHPLLTPIPKRWVNDLTNRILLNSLAHDARQDFVIWENKKYAQPPALAEGDGPIGKYRQWARQFYPD